MCSNCAEAFLLLKRRGFLIDQTAEGLCSLSPLSHQEDKDALGRILLETESGERCGDNLFIIHEDANISRLKEMFRPTDEHRGPGECGQKIDWSTIEYRREGYTLPVMWLDPYIAYYVKVLSACGFYTSGCCDGNHITRTHRPYVHFCWPIFSAYHRWLWEVPLSGLYEVPWKWSGNEASIRITGKYREEVFFELFHAAEYLFETRNKWIYIRQKAASGIDAEEANGISREHEEELSEKFIQEVNLIFNSL